MITEINNAIEIKDLCKQYKNFALKGIDLCVPKGSITGFVGQNGAGKTTVIKLILNLLSKKSGDIKIFGLNNIKNEIEIKDKIGIVFDQNHFNPNLKPSDLNKIMRYIYTDWDSKKYEAIIKRFKLESNQKIFRMSKGMQMKLQLAVALSHNAELLIMDEPTGGLDPIVRNEVLDCFLEFIQNSEHSILLSSHITSDLERVADYIAFIDGGKILLSESKLTLLETHKILKCETNKAPCVDGAEIIGKRQSSLGADILVKGMPEVLRKLEVASDNPSLDDIMYFYVKRNEAKADEKI